MCNMTHQSVCTSEIISGDEHLSRLEVHHAKQGVIQGHKPALPRSCSSPARDCSTPIELHLQWTAVQNLLLPQLLPSHTHTTCKSLTPLVTRYSTPLVMRDSMWRVS